MTNSAGTGGRWLEVAPARFPRWIASFGERHGGAPAVAVTGQDVTFTAPDGAVARCLPPFWESRPELPALAADPQTAASATAASTVADAVAAHALADRVVGVLLVRLGGYAAGVFAGAPPVLVAHKTGSRLVHGRSAAGGWSQQRFSRRREKQASEALRASATAAAEVFGRWGDTAIRSGEKNSVTPTDAHGGGTRGTGLDVVVWGGDKRAVADTVADPRLAPYARLATDRFLTVPDPKLAVLRGAPRLFLAVRIFLTEPAS